jgi:hypothetical protein
MQSLLAALDELHPGQLEPVKRRHVRQAGVGEKPQLDLKRSGIRLIVTAHRRPWVASIIIVRRAS